jgi:hypothetical protein
VAKEDYKQVYEPYVYRWTHSITKDWYIGCRYKQGCYPDDGYICSSPAVSSLILEDTSLWCREILYIGSSKEEVLEIEELLLKMLDAKRNCLSLNKSNGNGSFYNPNPYWMKGIPKTEEHKKKLKKPKTDEHKFKLSQYKGENHHGTGKLRPDHGRKMSGINNPMKDPAVALKLSGNNHWSKNPKNRLICEHCCTDIDKSNYKMYHGNNCKVVSNA